MVKTTISNLAAITGLISSALSIPAYAAVPLAAGQAQHAVIVLLPFLSAACLVIIIKTRSTQAKDAGQEAEVEVTISAREMALSEASNKFRLSQRERDVLDQWSQGRSRKDTGKKLFISPNTVATHVGEIYRKTDCHNRDELIEMMHQLEATVGKSA